MATPDNKTAYTDEKIFIGKGEETAVHDEAEHGKETDCGRERGTCPAAGDGHGHQQPHGDREAAAPRRRDAVRRTPGGGVDGVQAPQKRDRYWFRRDDDRAAAGHRVKSPVRCHTWILADS